MRVVDFQPEHMAALRAHLQPKQAVHKEQCTVAFGQQLVESGCLTWTAIAGDTVLGAFGIIPVWDGRAHVWAYVTTDAARHMLAISRAIGRQLAASGFRRYEAEVSDDFPAAHRWIRMLGFRCETQAGMPAFFPDGSKGFLYARVMY